MNRFIAVFLMVIVNDGAQSLKWNEFLHAENIFPVEHNSARSLLTVNSDQDISNPKHVLEELDSLLAHNRVLEQLYQNYLDKLLDPADVWEFQDQFYQQTFRETLLAIAKHNIEYRAGKVTWFEGVTPFTHLTRDEFKERYLTRGYIKPKIDIDNEIDPDLYDDLPDALDWRSNNGVNIVSPVKDQGTCGDCYAFQVTGMLESAYKKKYGGDFISLSEEAIRDCMPSFENENVMSGCNGESPLHTLGWVSMTGGLPYESDYPYQMDNVTHSCSLEGKTLHANIGSGDNSINATQTTADDGPLFGALAAYGPVGVGLDASKWPNNYKGGLYYIPCNSTDHAVLLVGYTPHEYIIKNSWNEKWGDHGFLHLERKRGGNNACISDTIAAYVTQMA